MDQTDRSKLEQRAQRTAGKLAGGWKLVEAQGVGPIDYQIVLTSDEAERIAHLLEVGRA